ncbi:MAG: YlxR family protein [Thermacetogeniaceae bacterium]|nr:YlxR family protein [Syntrophomonadaceae bacterium]
MPRIKKIPKRICVGCKETKNKKEMIRIVRTPDGEVKIDITGKMSGRGAYICRSKECLQTALAGKYLERALQVELPQDLAVDLEKMILGESS